MALPKLETPKHSCTLPSNGQIIEFRPFLVGEQKMLLIAQESENQNDVIREMMRLIDVCTDDVNVKNLPSIDIEFLFLQLRIKSVGETSDISVVVQEVSNDRSKIIINSKGVIESYRNRKFIVFNTSKIIDYNNCDSTGEYEKRLLLSLSKF